MAKANLTLPNGTTVAIEGTAEEVAALLAKVSGPRASVGKPRSNPGKKRASAPAKTTKARRKWGSKRCFKNLRMKDWFKSKRTTPALLLSTSGH